MIAGMDVPRIATCCESVDLPRTSGPVANRKQDRGVELIAKSAERLLLCFEPGSFFVPRKSLTHPLIVGPIGSVIDETCGGQFPDATISLWPAIVFLMKIQGQLV